MKRAALIGSAIAIVPVALGLVPVWAIIFLVPLFATVGASIAPKPPRLAKSVASARGEQDLKKSLDRMVSVVKRKQLSADIIERVSSIRDSIVNVLPRIMALKVMDKDIYHIRQTALSYLPEALDNYLTIPDQLALTHEIRDGKTAKDMLVEQLTILDDEMKDIVVDFDKDDLVKLEVHGRFLKDKFNKASLL